MCISYQVAGLYDGGWHSTDKEEMLSCYDDLTEEEAERICNELAILEEEANMKLTISIASYMDDDKREQVHAELAPCTNEEFLKRYLELDPEFEVVLKNEFGIEM